LLKAYLGAGRLEGRQIDGEGTFPGTRDNDELAPIPVIRSNGAQLVHST
jgi:hypothetical protein